MHQKKRFFSIVFAFCLLVLCAGGAWAQPDPNAMTSKAAILIEPQTGKVLFEKNADEKLEIASVTKIMTILLALEALERGDVTLQDQVPVSEYASSMGGSQVFLYPDETLPLYALLKATIVASANDADVALAEYIGGSYDGFIARMNARAQELGMANTLFANSTGLPADVTHYCTARDVAIMSRELIKHKTFFDYSTIWFENLSEARNNTEIANTNKLVRDYDGCDGIKTGSTDAAGFCLSATAQKGSTRYISVVLGAPDSVSRFNEAAALLDYGFASYETVKVMDGGTLVQADIPVKNGKEEFLSGLAEGDMYILKPLDHVPQLETKLNFDTPVIPPVTKGQQIGEIEFLVDGNPVGTLPMVADRDVAKAEFWDYMHKILDHWMGYPKPSPPAENPAGSPSPNTPSNPSASSVESPAASPSPMASPTSNNNPDESPVAE